MKCNINEVYVSNKKGKNAVQNKKLELHDMCL